MRFSRNCSKMSTFQYFNHLMMYFKYLDVLVGTSF